MKKMAFVIVLMTGASAFAHDHERVGHHACKAVWKACSESGKKGKDAKACVKTIKSGAAVDGVTVADADLKACQAASKEK